MQFKWHLFPYSYFYAQGSKSPKILSIFKKRNVILTNKKKLFMNVTSCMDQVQIEYELCFDLIQVDSNQ